MSPRPRPQRTSEKSSETIGDAEKKSRQQAEHARKRTDSVTPVAPDGWPVNEGGTPMAKITMTAAELIPNGQFANVSVGPAQLTVFIDPSRALEIDDDGNAKPYFSEKEHETMAAALNQIAEIVEVDVIAVQRNLVQESIQEQNSNGGS